MKYTSNFLAIGAMIGIGGVSYCLATPQLPGQTGQPGVAASATTIPLEVQERILRQDEQFKKMLQNQQANPVPVTTAAPSAYTVGGQNQVGYNSFYTAPSLGYSSGYTTPVAVQESGRTVWVSPAAHAHDQELDKLMREYQSVNKDADKNEVVTKLVDVVAKQFDERQTVRANELKQLEEQLTKLKSTHQKREEQKDRIVKDRVQQLLNNAEGLGWGGAGEGGDVVKTTSGFNAGGLGSFQPFNRNMTVQPDVVLRGVPARSADGEPKPASTSQPTTIRP